MANIYLHEVLDRWFEQVVKPRLEGKSFLIRYADDFVMVFSWGESSEGIVRTMGLPETHRLWPAFATRSCGSGNGG